MFLGIDIGTTKIAAVIVGPDEHVEATVSQHHHADLDTPAGRSEQDAQRLLDTTWSIVRELPAKLRRHVQAVGVTGQMHGLVLLDSHCQPLSPLITWQDQRCLEDDGFLPELNAHTGHELHTGCACATLTWLAEHGQIAEGATSAATIHDLAVARLCSMTKALTDPTSAASWGLFDLRALSWDEAAITAARFPRHLLPELRPCGSLAGCVTQDTADHLGLRPQTPVAVAIGDNQASLIATVRQPDKQLALTLGTGGQLSVILPADEALRIAGDCATCECRPYPGGRMAIVAASLSGGSAWTWLVQTIQSWAKDLGLPELKTEDVFAQINALGLQSTEELSVCPRFLGQRHAPDDRGAIGGIDLHNFRIGPLARGLARGIIEELRQMLPPRALSGRDHIVCSGNALRRNTLLQSMAEDVFGLPVIIAASQEEAATGAAMLGRPLADSPR